MSRTRELYGNSCGDTNKTTTDMDKCCYLCLRGESNELRDKELQGEVSDGVDVEGAGY